MPEDANGLILMSEGVKIHYKGTLDNILWMKRQQWTITNHALVLYAAVTALSKDTTDIERSALTGLALLGCAYALYCMWHTQRSMTRYYGNLFDVQQKYFTADENAALKMMKDRPEFFHNGAFIMGLMGANLCSFLVAFYFMWWKNGVPALHATAKTAAQIASWIAS